MNRRRGGTIDQKVAAGQASEVGERENKRELLRSEINQGMVCVRDAAAAAAVSATSTSRDGVRGVALHASK